MSKRKTTDDTARDEALIAYVLGDAPPSAALEARLRTPEGRDATARYRRVLDALDAWGADAGREAPAHRSPKESDRPTVYYGTVATPLGAVLAAVGERGLLEVSFERAARTFAARLARRHRAAAVRADERLASVRAQLLEYLRGARTAFDLPVDLRSVSPFQRRVLAAARRIPRGRVLSYGDIARRIGQPRAARAVGQALGRNPIPIVIPCHRVVSGGGRLGGYVGGTARKRKLLALEGVAPRTGRSRLYRPLPQRSTRSAAVVFSDDA